MTRDELISSILGKSSPAPLRVELESGAVFVRVMTAYDADQTRKKLDSIKKDDGCETGRLLACLLCDDQGTLLFDAGNEDTVLKLSKLPPKMQHAILGAANQANNAGNA